MSKSKIKIGRCVSAGCALVCITAVFICSPAVPVTALQAEDTVTVTVNAPEYVEEEETFDVIHRRKW
jgi:hypothetical protein